MRKSSIKAGAAVGLLAGLAALAVAGVLIETGFESTAFTANQLIDGQDGWISPTAREAAYVADQGANHGQNCVKILGDKLEHVSGHVWKGNCGKFLNYDPVSEGTPIVHMRASAKLVGAPGTGTHPDGMNAIV